MSKKSVKTYSGKKPLKSSLKRGNILKEPSPSDNADTDSNSKDSNNPRRSLRNVKEEQTKENRQLKEKGTTSNWVQEIEDVYIECVKVEDDKQSVKVKEERQTPEKEFRKPDEETTETPATEGSAVNTPKRNVAEHSCSVCSKSFKSAAGLKIHSNKCRNSAIEVNNSVIVIKSEKIAPEDDEAALEPESPTKKGGKPLPNEWTVAIAECYCCGEDLQTAHRTGEFQCYNCGKLFLLKASLERHQEVIHLAESHKCPQCGAKFPNKRTLARHMYTHTGRKQYRCDFCPKRFQYIGEIKKHRRTHTGMRPFKCDTCGKKFAAKETLNRHVPIHTGYKPHACQYCEKRFIQSSQLRSHLLYHTGQKVKQPAEVLICELCGKTFNRRARLNEHTKFIHFGAKPFKCKDCKKTFIRRADLNRHHIIHSGVKDHKCPKCSKCFNMKSALKVHLLTHNKELPIPCYECGRAYIRQDCLLRHIRRKHRDMLEEIRSEAEKNKLQQQLLQVAAEASLVKGAEDKGELDEKGLLVAVSELLSLLVDDATLKGLGSPEEGVETILEAVVQRCGRDPAPLSTPSHERLRHNVKLLFMVAIDDSAIESLLNNQTIDQVILHTLRLAKS